MNQYGGTVTLIAALQPINVDLEVELMLLGARNIAIVSHLPLHVLVESPETVTKRGVLDSLLVSDHVVVECFQAWDGVDDEVTVAGDRANGIGKQGDVHNHR